uniref:AlNc14C2G289 protein n=1 Tax=Albugo laibachii Nc14 TaxID=890382 RepID=F0VZF1_9STRA|nr:AlNc14C2G289 [Albugo laibachii Nc14]|eukprot:CCA14181.1 AlNc14C2G289 [Albugo laibachii Nc14]
MTAGGTTQWADLRDRKHVIICDMSKSCLLAIAILSQKVAGDAVIFDVGDTSNYPYLQYVHPNARHGIPVYTTPMITRGSSVIKEFYGFIVDVIAVRQKTLIVLADESSANQASDLMDILQSRGCKWERIHSFALGNILSSSNGMNRRAEYGLLNIISAVDAPLVLHSTSLDELRNDCIEAAIDFLLANKIKEHLDLKTQYDWVEQLPQLICSSQVMTALSILMPESHQHANFPDRGYIYDFLKVNKVPNPRFTILSKRTAVKALLNHFLKQMESNTACRDEFIQQKQKLSATDAWYPLIVPSRTSSRLSEEYFPFHE